MTCNEVLYSPKKPDASILAIVEFLAHAGRHLHGEPRPFQRVPCCSATGTRLKSNSESGEKLCVCNCETVPA